MDINKLKEIEENMEVPILRKEDNIKYPNGPTKDFYSLPLTDEQRKQLYEEIMKVYNESGPEAFQEQDQEQNNEEKK